ncbi:hypothetical protein KW786_00495 [Candidatus Parcubacteria bacterium]|nr:hypothetical protein [Candidatus Parcubacteria bacterium]
MNFKKFYNTKKEGTFHFKIFKFNGRYLGICWETGDVQEGESFEKVKERLLNGTHLILTTVIKSQDDLLGSINTKPPFRYQIMYRLSFVLSFIESFKNNDEETYFVSSKPIPSF